MKEIFHKNIEQQKCLKLIIIRIVEHTLKKCCVLTQFWVKYGLNQMFLLRNAIKKFNPTAGFVHI